MTVTAQSATNPGRILVIRRDNIGDLVCTTPLLSGLRLRFPDAMLAVLVNSYNAGVLRGNPDIDATHVYRKLKHRLPGESRLAAVWHRIRLIIDLRRQHFDTIVLAKSSFDAYGLRFARLVGAPCVIGFAPSDGRRVRGLTDPVTPPQGVLRHEVEALSDLGARLGVEPPLPPLTVIPDPVERERQRARLPQHLDGPTKMVALHISARERSRRWLPDKIVELVRQLAADPAQLVVLMWAPGAEHDPMHPGDDALARDVIARCAGLRLVALPTHSLDELIAALSLCSGFIGADGGAMHLAAGVGLPVVGLFENSAFKLQHWYPWRVPHELVHAGDHDVAGIEVADVVAAWHRLQLAPPRP